ncbi:MAG: signal peptidase II [Nitrospinota bacterium]
MNWKYSPFMIIVFLFVILDQITKFYIIRNFELYRSVEIIRGYFSITHIRNTGVAFGMFSDLNNSFTQIFFIVVSLIAIVVIFIVYIESHNIVPFTRIAFSLILSGAFGNLIDRIFRGEVVDFLDFHWHEYHWPAFNMADSCITIGVGLLMITMVGKRKAVA